MVKVYENDSPPRSCGERKRTGPSRTATSLASNCRLVQRTVVPGAIVRRAGWKV